MEIKSKCYTQLYNTGEVLCSYSSSSSSSRIISVLYMLMNKNSPIFSVLPQFFQFLSSSSLSSLSSFSSQLNHLVLESLCKSFYILIPMPFSMFSFNLFSLYVHTTAVISLLFLFRSFGFKVLL